GRVYGCGRGRGEGKRCSGAEGASCEKGVRHLGLGRRFLAATHGLLRPLTRASVGLRALPVDGEAATVADAAVRADFLQALDRLGPLAPEVALHMGVRVDVTAELPALGIGQVTQVRRRTDPYLGQPVPAGRRPR